MSFSLLASCTLGGVSHSGDLRGPASALYGRCGRGAEKDQDALVMCQRLACCLEAVNWVKTASALKASAANAHAEVPTTFLFDASTQRKRQTQVLLTGPPRVHFAVERTPSTRRRAQEGTARSRSCPRRHARRGCGGACCGGAELAEGTAHSIGYLNASSVCQGL